MVLANGRHTFSCGPIPGWFQLDVPLDENGESTLFAFAEGFAPYRRTFVPDGVPIAVDTQYADGQSPTPVLSIQRRDAPSVPNWVEITGTVAAVDGTPLCGMVLANGQYTFSCDDAMGEFSLTVPPDTDNSVTVFGFVDGFMPAKQAVAP